MLGDVAEVVLSDDLDGEGAVVGAEDHDALATEEEGVHVDEADAGLAEGLDGVGGASRLVVELELFTR